MLNAILAALCMVAVDVLSTVMIQADSANRGWLAGIMDMLGWYPSIICTTLCVLALDGKSVSAKVAVLVLVGAANLFGTKLGQVVGKWFLTRSARKRAGLVAPPQTQEERLDYLERLLGVKRAG
jgi:hypothetical protein